MTFDEKVGQLFMVAAYSNKDDAHYDAIEKLITENKIGGLIFFKEDPSGQFNQSIPIQIKKTLFIGMMPNGDLSMRLDSTYTYPWNMTLGAVQDMNLIEKLSPNGRTK
jgi:beta-glucosidase-like glycosyl hydrolase